MALKQLTTLGLVLIVSGCGGGGGSNSGGNVVVADPKVSVYSEFDLSESMPGGVYQDCLDVTSEINLMRYVTDAGTGRSYQKVFTLRGSFTMPKGATSCSITNATGTITSASLTYASNLIYNVTDLNMPISTIGLGYKSFWSSIALQTGKVISKSTSSYRITCRDSANKLWYTPLVANADISGFFFTCNS